MASAVLALCALPAAALASSQSLANSLQSDPVQTIGVPKSSFTSLSPSQIVSLKAEIANRDPGRIWILVVSPRSESSLANLAQPVFNDMPAGTLIVLANDPNNPNNSNWWVGSSWEDSQTAQTELSDVIQGYKNGQGSIYDDLQLEIGSFAYRDSQAGDPASGSGNNSGGSGGTGAALGLILGLGIPLALIVVPFMIFGGRRWKRSRQKTQEAEDKHVDARAKAQTDLVKLGDEITRLDIDSSLANANPQGKDEYRHALGCYEAGERRLKDSDAHPDDEYKFKQAVWAIEAGLRHIGDADKLFNPAPDPVKDVDDLTKLAALHQRGALTDAEFAEQKAKLIK